MPVTRGRLALPSCPEDCPADIFELIKDCTAHDPDDRPTAKECFERMKVCAAHLERCMVTGLRPAWWGQMRAETLWWGTAHQDECR